MAELWYVKFKLHIKCLQVAIVLITKMMLRISAMSELGETCFVDSSGGVDRDGTRFFMFLGRCHAGGVPLAVVLTTSENQKLLTNVVETLKVYKYQNVLVKFILKNCSNYFRAMLLVAGLT